MQNKFSIIIPVHGDRGPLLQRALTSILDQTYAHFECIIVDDHCVNNIQKIIDSFDDRFKVIRMTNTGNRYFARNLGMKNIINDWVCWLDSDDEYESIYLEAFNDAINEFSDYKCFNCATLVHHNRKDQNNKKAYYKYSTVRHTFKPKELDVGHVEFESGKIGTGQFVFHKSVIDEIGYLPEAKTWWTFADMSGIKGYGSNTKPLGNPWGEDYYYFYKITRKFKSKPLELTLYVNHLR